MAELPPSLAVTPNIAWEHQSLDQLRAERDYWAARAAEPPYGASTVAAEDFRRGCEAWIRRRDVEAAPPREGGK